MKTKQHHIIITAALVAALVVLPSHAKTTDEKVKAPTKSAAPKPVSKQSVKAPNKSSTTNAPKVKTTIAQKPAIANPKTNPAVRPDVKSATKPAPKVTTVPKKTPKIENTQVPQTQRAKTTTVVNRPSPLPNGVVTQRDTPSVVQETARIPKVNAPNQPPSPVLTSNSATERLDTSATSAQMFLSERQNKELSEPIYQINQRFARVPTDYCPVVSNGYGFEVSYSPNVLPKPNSSGAPSSSEFVFVDADAPVVSKVYGNAYAAGLKEGAQLATLNGEWVRSQNDVNRVLYQGKAKQVANLLPEVVVGMVYDDGSYGTPQNPNIPLIKDVRIKRADYCLSNLTVESERNILRMDFSIKGTGYSTKADARVYVDPSFLDSLNEPDLLTLSAVAAGEQYRQGLRVKRGKTGLFIGQVFGTIVTLFTGVPVTDLTASGASAVGMADRNEDALRPAVTYGYYLGVAPADMRASLEKLASYREGYKVQGKRYDWPIPDDLSQFDSAQAELKKLIDSNAEDLMLEPKQPSEIKKEVVEPTIVTPPASETGEGVGNY